MEKELKEDGLEGLGKFYGVYRGYVVSNVDPLNIGRLKVGCPELYGDQEPDTWVFPRGMPAGLGHGIYWIPSEKDPVLISCINGDPRFPLWEYGWWLKDNTPEGAMPGVYLFVTPGGQRIELNDNTHIVKITNDVGFQVEIRPDGLFIGKETFNLGKFLDDLFQLLTTTTVNTPAPTPFNNVAAYTALRAQIASFLKTS